MADFAAWSGLPAADTRRAWDLIADALVPVPASAPVPAWGSAPGPGERLSALAGGDDAGPPADPAPRLLGHFDPYLLGYRDRGLVLDPRDARRGTARITVEPFAALPEASQAGLAAEAADIGRFLGAEVTFGIAPAA